MRKRVIFIYTTIFLIVSALSFPIHAQDISVKGRVEYAPFFKVYPERRLPIINNWQNQTIVDIRPAGSKIPLFTQVVDTQSDGSAQMRSIDVSIVPPGEYDIAVKGYSHLKKVYSGVVFKTHAINLDLTGIGDKLLAGDTVSDNTINSLDLAYMKLQLYSSSDIRADLNRDSYINALDISNIAVNYYAEGDQ